MIVLREGQGRPPSGWCFGPRTYGYDGRFANMERAYEGKRLPVAYWYFVAWDCVSFGAHVSFQQPNIELHLPFGFIRIGWQCPRSPGKMSPLGRAWARWQAGRNLPRRL